MYVGEARLEANKGGQQWRVWLHCRCGMYYGSYSRWAMTSVLMTRNKAIMASLLQCTGTPLFTIYLPITLPTYIILP